MKSEVIELKEGSIDDILHRLITQIRVVHTLSSKYSECMDNLEQDSQSILGYIAEFENAEKEITSVLKTGNSELSDIFKELDNYLNERKVAIAIFSELTQYCIKSKDIKVVVQEVLNKLEQTFPETSELYRTYHDCYLDSVFSAIRAGRETELAALIYTLYTINDSGLGNPDIARAKLHTEHAITFSILLREDKLEKTDNNIIKLFNEMPHTEIMDILTNGIKHAYKLDKRLCEKFGARSQVLYDEVINRVIEEDFKQMKHFSYLITFIIGKRDLAVFHQGSDYIMRLNQMYKDITNRLTIKDSKIISYFTEDLLWELAQRPEEDFLNYYTENLKRDKESKFNRDELSLLKIIHKIVSNCRSVSMPILTKPEDKNTDPLIYSVIQKPASLKSKVEKIEIQNNFNKEIIKQGDGEEDYIIVDVEADDNYIVYEKEEVNILEKITAPSSDQESKKDTIVIVDQIYKNNFIQSNNKITSNSFDITQNFFNENLTKEYKKILEKAMNEAFRARLKTMISDIDIDSLEKQGDLKREIENMDILQDGEQIIAKFSNALINMLQPNANNIEEVNLGGSMSSQGDDNV